METLARKPNLAKNFQITCKHLQDAVLSKISLVSSCKKQQDQLPRKTKVPIKFMLKILGVNFPGKGGVYENLR